MGILSKLYQYCDVAVIGGSFNSVGGHNFIEPIMFKRPLLLALKCAILKKILWNLSQEN